RLPYAVSLATENNSLTHYTKGTPSPPCGGSDCLYAYGFRYYFTPLAGVLFTFPSRYWFTIGRKLVFSLAGWSRQFLAGFHVSRDTQEPLEGVWHFHLRGYHPLWPAFPDRSINASSSLVYSVSSLSPGPTPNIVVLQPRALLSNRSVWAFPISLATTFGISVDFS